jgi:hypothetical protein
MEDLVISDDRAKGIRRLLLVTLGFVAVLVLLAILFLTGDYVRYGVVVLVIAALLGGAAWLSLTMLRSRSAAARRASILTGVLLVVLSVPLIPIWIGLLTVVTGIGLLVVILAPEREAP